MKYLHSMIRVKDIKEALKFYCDFIGLKLINKYSLDDCDLYYVGEDENSCLIELTYNDDTPKEGYENGKAFGHFAFEVKDMEKTAKKLKEMGYKFLYEPYEIDLKNEEGKISHLKIAFINDPDGNEIELIEN